MRVSVICGFAGAALAANVNVIEDPYRFFTLLAAISLVAIGAFSMGRES